MDLSIIIPAYNESSCIPALLDRLDKVINGVLANYKVEVIIVDDHSTDDTPIQLRAACEKLKWLKRLRLLKNSGSHIAIFAGLTKARGQNVYCMGADLQDPPEIIPQFMAKMKEGNKVVFGERLKRKDPFIKILQAKIFYFLMVKFVMKKYPIAGGDVFMIDRDIVNAIITSSEKNVNIFVLMLSFCDDVGSVGYERLERHSGYSKWNFTKLMKLAFDSVVTVGAFPLKLIFWAGILFFFFSILAISYLIYAKMVGLIQLTGWASTLAAIFGIGGLQMICLSVLGNYLWRNFEQTKMRPIFILEQDKNDTSI